MQTLSIKIYLLFEFHVVQQSNKHVFDKNFKYNFPYFMPHEWTISALSDKTIKIYLLLTIWFTVFLNLISFPFM